MRDRTKSTAATLNPNERLLKATEAAELLGLSVRMIHRLVATSDLAKVKIGKAARFRLSDVVALMRTGVT